MHVYSLGMTLYWSAGFHVPQNQVCKQDTQSLARSCLWIELAIFFRTGITSLELRATPQSCGFEEGIASGSQKCSR